MFKKLIDRIMFFLYRKSSDYVYNNFLIDNNNDDNEYQKKAKHSKYYVARLD